MGTRAQPSARFNCCSRRPAARGEAKSRGDYGWIGRTFRRSLLYTVAIAVPGCLIFAIFGRPLILLWTHKPEALPSQELLLLMTAYTFILAMSAPCNILLNGLGRLVGQAIYGMIAAVGGVFLMYVFSRRYGASGIPIALIVAWVPTYLVFNYWESLHALRKLQEVRESA